MAQALEGAPAQLVGSNFKSRGEFQPSKSSIYAMGYGPRAPALGGLSFLILAEDLFLGGGGGPMQALALGRWRPSAATEPPHSHLIYLEDA